MVWLFSFCMSFVLMVSANEGKITFEKKSIIVGGQSLHVEIADTGAKQEQGLMNRNSLKDGEGMLFVFEDARARTFWMKNTFVDLDIGFFDKNKKLFDIQTMKASPSVMETHLQTYQSQGPALYALEVPAGWFGRKKIKKGSTLSFK